MRYRQDERRVCPVCRGLVLPTTLGHICGHMDKTKRSPCPASFELDFDKALLAHDDTQPEGLQWH